MCVQAIRAGKLEVTLPALFSKCRGLTKRVNLVGSAGIGKSTVCQCIVSQWSSGSLFPEFPLVLWVHLRHMTSERYPMGDNYTVLDVIARECLGVPLSPRLRSALGSLYDPYRSLWILDGYDEIVGRVPAHLSPAFTHMMSGHNRLLTGRPHAMMSLPCDVRVEVAGFRDENITEFVGRFLNAMAADPGAGSVNPRTHPVYGYMRSHPLVWELAHVPINLVLLCHVLQDGAIDTDLSLTELYAHVEERMWRRYCQRQGCDMHALTTAMLREQTGTLAHVLSLIAFRGMQDGVVLLPGASIQDWLLSCDCRVVASSSDTLWDLLGDCGVLLPQSVTPDPRDAQFLFLHLTLQEYFAAQHVARECRAGRSVTSSPDLLWLCRHKCLPRLEVMWWFLGGLLGAETSPSPPDVGLSLIADMWCLPPRPLDAGVTTRVWLRIIEEGRLFTVGAGHASLSSLHALVKSTILTDVLSALRSPGKSLELPWVPTLLRDCPLFCSAVLLCEDSVVEALQSVLSGADVPVRSAVMSLLKGLGSKLVDHEWALTHLRSSLDGGWLRCDQAVDVMQSIGWRDFRQDWMVEWVKAGVRDVARDTVRWAAANILHDGGPTLLVDHPWALEWLVQSLSPASDAVCRWTGLKVLEGLAWGALSHAECAAGLQAALSEDVVVIGAFAVVKSLGVRGSTLPFAQQAVVRCLSSSDRTIRSAAVSLAVSFGASALSMPGMMDVMVESLRITARRSDALTILSSFPPSDVTRVQWLQDWLLRGLGDDMDALAVLHVLSIFNTAALDLTCVLPGLGRMLHYSDWRHRNQALVVIKSLLPQALQNLDIADGVCRALSDRYPCVSMSAVALLRLLGHRVLDFPWVLDWLVSSPVSGAIDRGSTYTVLAAIGSVSLQWDSAITWLQSLLSQDDVALPLKLLECLGPDVVGCRPLCDELVKLAGDDDPARSVPAMHTLASLGRHLIPAMYGPVAAALSSAHELLVKAAVSVVKGCGEGVFDHSPLLTAFLALFHTLEPDGVVTPRLFWGVLSSFGPRVLFDNLSSALITGAFALQSGRKDMIPVFDAAGPASLALPTFADWLGELLPSPEHILGWRLLHSMGPPALSHRPIASGFVTSIASDTPAIRRDALDALLSLLNRLPGSGVILCEELLSPGVLKAIAPRITLCVEGTTLIVCSPGGEFTQQLSAEAADVCLRLLDPIFPPL